MTVGQLIEKLTLEDADRIVVLSKDEEGNGFSELYSIQTASFDPEEGEIGLEESDLENGADPEDVLGKRGVPALVLWP